MNRILTVWTCLALAAGAQAQGIRLKAGGRGFSGREPGASRVLPRHFVLEFHSYPGPEIRQELARRGIRTLQYLPDNGLAVSSATAPDLRGLDLVSAGALAAEDKLSPLLAVQDVAGYVVVFHPDSDMQVAREIVRDIGLSVVESAALLSWQLLVTGSYRDVAALAKDDLVAYILPASPDLMAGAPVMSCAGAVVEAGMVADYVEVGKGWAKDAAGNVSLTYFFQSLTEKMDENSARAEIERALGEWTRYTNLALTRAQQAGLARSIDILFARRGHGDPYPFDGPGGVLAHTFYPSPPNAEPVAGDMHLDADESWHAGSAVDLYTVALHEAGHALGLGHSDQPGTVMYPYYHLASGLTSDDIAGIRALYGDNSGTPGQPTGPTPKPTPTPTPTPKPTPTPPTPGPGSGPLLLTITSPGSTMVSTSAASVAISGTATGNVTVVKWTTGFGDAGTASGTANWSSSVPLFVGNNTITVAAYDGAGNSSWRAITVVRH